MIYIVVICKYHDTSDDIFMLVAGLLVSLYLWTGSKSSPIEKKESFTFAQKYITEVR